MRSLGTGMWNVNSAGVLSSFVHPLAIQVMKEIGIDISHQSSKSIDDFLNEEFDYVITLCDYAAMTCPTFPSSGERLHWPFEDPAAAIGTIEKRLAVFRKIRDEIRIKIEEFLKVQNAG